MKRHTVQLAELATFGLRAVGGRGLGKRALATKRNETVEAGLRGFRARQGRAHGAGN